MHKQQAEYLEGRMETCQQDLSKLEVQQTVLASCLLSCMNSSSVPKPPATCVSLIHWIQIHFPKDTLFCYPFLQAATELHVLHTGIPLRFCWKPSTNRQKTGKLLRENRASEVLVGKADL